LSDEVDWRVVTNKVANLFVERVKDIRRDVPADEIVSRTIESFSKSSFSVTTEDATGDLDVGHIAALIRQINESHHVRIRLLASSLGEVVGESHLDEVFATDIFGFAGEEESHVLMRVDGTLIRVGKEAALKVLALGYVP